MNTTRIAPQNSVVFVTDVRGGMPPQYEDGKLINHNEFCVGIVCYPEIDGETEIVLAGAFENGFSEMITGLELAYDGNIATPSKVLLISTVMDEPVLQEAVPETVTRLRVWISHPKWPEKVVIGWG